mmetsp:Transcript_9946/g.21879  ORF Transcript_9946/g.21879 Transcript_9946/m.21879 type:complete len:85 (-) Transcript_9946:176-430(-)
MEEPDGRPNKGTEVQAKDHRRSKHTDRVHEETNRQPETQRETKTDEEMETDMRTVKSLKKRQAKDWGENDAKTGEKNNLEKQED